jgi:hypothetical protein
LQAVIDALGRAGANLTLDSDRQMPYFFACFYGRTDILAVIEMGAPEVAQQQAQLYARLEAEHASPIEPHRSADCNAVNRHRGRGYVTSN